jgi:hypothetical protein
MMLHTFNGASAWILDHRSYQHEKRADGDQGETGPARFKPKAGAGLPRLQRTIRDHRRTGLPSAEPSSPDRRDRQEEHTADNA